MVAAQLHQIARQMRRNNIAHIRSELASLPCIRAGSRTNHGSKLEVLRYYTKEQGKRTVHQHDATTEKGVELQSLMKQKEQLTAFLESLPLQKELECEISSCSEKQSINSGRFSKARFDQLLELKDTSISKGLPFDGRLFRSKSEVMIAQYLKELGLEYKYEVIVSIGGKEARAERVAGTSRIFDGDILVEADAVSLDAISGDGALIAVGYDDVRTIVV